MEIRTAEKIVSDIKMGAANNVFTNEQINEMARALQYARASLAREVKYDLRPGITVYFKNRYGSRVIATVESVKIKNAIVNSNGHRYRVPINMLTFK